MPFSSGLKRLRARLAHSARHTGPGRAEQRQRSTAEALLAVSRAVTGDWGESIPQIVQLDAQAMGVERVTLWTSRSKPAGLRCEAGFIASIRIQERGMVLLENDAPEYFAAMRDARVMVVRDVRADPRCPGLRDYCASRRISAMLNVPLRVGGELVGLLCHEHVGPTRRWSERDQDIAAGAARIVESALAAREHTQTEASARRAALLDSASRVVLQSLDRCEIATRAVSFFVPEIADTVIVYGVDREGARPQWLAARDSRPGNAGHLAEARLSSETGQLPVVTLIMRERQSLLLPDVHSSVFDRYGVREEFGDLARKLEVRSAMAVPIAVGSKALGVLFVLSANRRYGSGDLELVESVAERVAWAMENARVYGLAREAIQARDEFLALASRELRTPLTALRLVAESSVQRARRRGDEAEAERFRLVATHSERLTFLVGRMVELLTTRAAGVVLVPQACDLTTIVARGVRMARAQAPPIRLTAPAGLTGRWDPVGLERAIGELLDNAIRFGARRPVEVVLRRDQDVAELSVRDHGIGIPPDRLDSVFSPLERAVPARHAGGLGLGLYLARAIVEAHGGSIALSSRVAEGTLVVVRLPVFPHSDRRLRAPVSSTDGSSSEPDVDL
jgi:signal transduction histidine kinase